MWMDKRIQIQALHLYFIHLSQLHITTYNLYFIHLSQLHITTYILQNNCNSELHRLQVIYVKKENLSLINLLRLKAFYLF